MFFQSNVLLGPILLGIVSSCGAKSDNTNRPTIASPATATAPATNSTTERVIGTLRDQWQTPKQEIHSLSFSNDGEELVFVTRAYWPDGGGAVGVPQKVFEDLRKRTMAEPHFHDPHIRVLKDKKTTFVDYGLAPLFTKDDRHIVYEGLVVSMSGKLNTESIRKNNPIHIFNRATQKTRSVQQPNVDFSTSDNVIWARDANAHLIGLDLNQKRLSSTKVVLKTDDPNNFGAIVSNKKSYIIRRSAKETYVQGELLRLDKKQPTTIYSWKEKLVDKTDPFLPLSDWCHTTFRSLMSINDDTATFWRYSSYRYDDQEESCIRTDPTIELIDVDLSTGAEKSTSLKNSQDSMWEGFPTFDGLPIAMTQMTDPTGDWLVFTKKPKLAQSIWVRNRKTGNEYKVFEFPIIDGGEVHGDEHLLMNYAWSPKGDSIALVSGLNVDGDKDDALYVVDIDWALTKE